MALEADKIAEAADMSVWDKQGNKQRFGDLFSERKTVVVFIRHFFCGMCQAYVSQFNQVASDALAAADTSIIVVGCGEWKLIQNYHEATGFTGQIYANPSRDIYRALGMTYETLSGTPSGEQKRSYVKGAFVDALRSTWRGPLLHLHHLGKQGNISQNGGDFVLGPGNDCSFAHVMKHTQDHVEVADLMQAAGVKYP